MGLYSKLLKCIANFQVKHPYLTIFIILLVTIFLYGGVSKVKTVASLEQMMPKQIDEISAFNTLRDYGMGQDIIAIVFEVNKSSSDPFGVQDITDKRVYDYINYIDSSLKKNPDIIQTYSLKNIIDYAKKEQEISSLDRTTYYSLIKNPLLKKSMDDYVNIDKTITFMIITTDVSANDPRMNSLASKIKSLIYSAGHPPGVSITLTGTPVIQQKLGKLILKDRRTTQLISTIIVFIITMLLFGTFTSAIVPIIVVTLSINWLYGIMGYTNLPISTLAGGVAAMVIGIGIDYAIHLMNKFKNERKAGHDINSSIETAVQDTGTSLTGAAIATIVAFLAFLLGHMPEMNRFGLLMSIGVGGSFILSIFGLPALLIIEEKIIHKFFKRLRFGPEGDIYLYEKDEVHPDDHRIIEPTIEELRSIAKKYKLCKPVKKIKKTKRKKV